MKISNLKSPYKELAELRRKQYYLDAKEDDLLYAFSWMDVLEGDLFWDEVDNGGQPEIPKESLEELKLNN